MPPATPYAADLGDRDPLAAMHDSAERIRVLTDGWAPDAFERSYAPGKWSARLILTHLAQSEIAFGYRVRMALSVKNYTAQPFDQDVWMAHEHAMSGRDAAAAFVALSRMNELFYRTLSAADRQVPLHHPEYGALSVDWVIHQTAGHQWHHLVQLEQIGHLANVSRSAS